MGFFQEFNGLDEITIDGREYVDKKELLALIKDEKKRHMEATEPGYLHQKKSHKIAAAGSLNRLAVLVNKRFYDELNKDVCKILIACAGGENGLIAYFRGWCNHVPGEAGKPMPVFSEDPHDAVRFESRDEAKKTIKTILEDHPNLDMYPVLAGFTRNKSGLRVIHSIFGWPEDRDPNDILEDELFFTKTLG